MRRRGFVEITIPKESKNMKRSLDRILTTHVGSLTRPPEIIEMMRARTSNQPYDEKSFADSLRSSVSGSCAGRLKSVWM